ncbi:MAG: aldehyde dehydrogenase [Bacteroidales bacterium]|nr:aldehyde dehydrogenase [Bacteroidales bacterium]
MENTPLSKIESIVARQKEFFSQGATRDLTFRKDSLRRLYGAIKEWEPAIEEALMTDLHKSGEEGYITETGLVLSEISDHLRHLRHWARTERKRTPLTLFPSAGYVVKEPLGTVLIISPWNYPVQLLLTPLVGALSAGCTAVLKPSPYVPNVSRVLQEMIEHTFDQRQVAVVQGNREVNANLLAQRWDLIFFTGSPALGRTVMESASRNLTPVVLELGGKSPCIVDEGADVKIAARRCLWGKCLNSGQTCIAPDYLLVHDSLRDSFLEEFDRQKEWLYREGLDKDTPHYGHIVRDAAFERVVNYMKDGTVLSGGRYDAESRFIEPTILGDVPPDAPVMTEEIFGPVFPMMTFGEISEVERFVNSREKPLALYYFGSVKKGRELIRHTTSGGACINDTIMHVANPNLPFGGVGNSGMGSYHSRLSYEAFTHRRSILVTPTKVDMPFRYMPYRFIRLVRRLLK